MCTVGSKIPALVQCLNGVSVRQKFWWHRKTGKWIVSTYRPSFQIPLKKLDYLVLFSGRAYEHKTRKRTAFICSSIQIPTLMALIWRELSIWHFFVSYFNSGDKNSGQVWCSFGKHQLSCQMFQFSNAISHPICLVLNGKFAKG